MGQQRKILGGGRETMSLTAKTDGGAEARTVILGSLTHPRRRLILYYLHDRSGPVEADELARQVLAWETNTAVGNITDNDCERVVTGLYHNHLPKLADAGLIEYDQETLTARSLDHAELPMIVLKYVNQTKEEIDT